MVRIAYPNIWRHIMKVLSWMWQHVCIVAIALTAATSVLATVGTYGVYFRYGAYDLSNPIAIALVYAAVWLLNAAFVLAAFAASGTIALIGMLMYASAKLGRSATYDDLNLIYGAQIDRS